jgi:translin
LTEDPVAEIREILDSRFQARETAITRSRLVIRNAANGIRALHRGEWEEAAGLIGESGEELSRINDAVAEHPDLAQAGFVSDAAKEYAEARICEAVFQSRKIPDFDELGIDPVPYLHGLGEAVGEMRRWMLDLLREERLEEADDTLEEMDRIVDLLATIDYPDGMTNGLRRTTDVARSLVERSRSDLTATVVQERLRRDLRG